MFSMGRGQGAGGRGRGAGARGGPTWVPLAVSAAVAARSGCIVSVGVCASTRSRSARHVSRSRARTPGGSAGTMRARQGAGSRGSRMSRVLCVGGIAAIEAGVPS